MNEEQLASLLAEHLDAILAGGPIPDDLPPEVADLLGIAPPLADAAPTARPEFGADLKETLHAPDNDGGTGSGPGADNSTLFAVGIGLLVLLAGGALVSLLIFAGARTGLSATTAPTPAPVETQPTASVTASPAPTQATVAPSQVITTTATIEPSASPTPAQVEPTASPTVTPTPIIDVLPAVTVSVDVQVNPPSLSPGSGGSGGSSGGGGDDNNNDDDDDDD